MKSLKVWSLLEGLSTRERERLADYLASPFFSASAAVRQFYGFLLEEAFHLGAGIPEKAQAWAAAFPDQAYDDTAFRTLCTHLLRHVEGFLAHLHLQRQSLERDRILLGELEQRSMDKHLRYVLGRQEKALEKAPLRDERWLRQRFALQQVRYRFAERESRRSTRLAPIHAAEALDAAYLAERLRLTCELRNLQHILQMDRDVGLPESLPPLMAQAQHRDQPAVALYRAVWGLLDDASPEAAYRTLRERIEHLGQRLPREQQQGLYIYAVNFCIRQANRGETRYLEELLDLYREALDREVLLDRGHLPSATYKNIVTVGLRVGEYPWVQRFIRSYRSKLPPDKRENAYTYNLAKYYFTVRRYDDVLPLLREVEYEDVFYALDAKVMLLKVYYETGEWEALHSLFDAFAVFLRRNKVLSSYHKTINLNFIKAVRRLSSTPPGERERLRKLRERIEERREVTDINWLLERIREKEKKRA